MKRFAALLLLYSMYLFVPWLWDFLYLYTCLYILCHFNLHLLYISACIFISNKLLRVNMPHPTLNDTRGLILIISLFINIYSLLSNNFLLILLTIICAFICLYLYYTPCADKNPIDYGLVTCLFVEMIAQYNTMGFKTHLLLIS